MNAIIGTNTWDYLELINRMAAEYHNPKNRSQRSRFRRKVERPLAKRSYKSSVTDLAYFKHMSGAERMQYAITLRVFGKQAAHEFVRKLKKKHGYAQQKEVQRR